MLPKKNRVNLRFFSFREQKLLFKKRFLFFNCLCFIPKTEADNGRLAIIIKKNLIKSAVDRNKIRRHIHSFFQSSIPVKNALIIILQRVPDKKTDLITLNNDLDQALKQWKTNTIS